MITLGNILKKLTMLELTPWMDVEKRVTYYITFYDPPPVVTSKSKARVKKYIQLCTCRASGFGFYRPIMEAWT